MYQELYFGRVAEQLRQVCDGERWDAVLFTAPDVPWIPDSQRNLQGRREEVSELLLRQFEQRGLRIMPVRGAWDERFRMACEALAHVLHG